MSPKENMLRLIRRDNPRWVPNGMESVITLGPPFVLARPGVTPGEVRSEVRRRVDEMATGGGYIAAPSHGVPYKPEIIHAMNDEINKYGRSFYQ